MPSTNRSVTKGPSPFPVEAPGKGPILASLGAVSGISWAISGGFAPGGGSPPDLRLHVVSTSVEATRSYESHPVGGCWHRHLVSSSLTSSSASAAIPQRQQPQEITIRQRATVNGRHQRTVLQRAHLCGFGWRYKKNRRSLGKSHS